MSIACKSDKVQQSSDKANNTSWPLSREAEATLRLIPLHLAALDNLTHKCCLNKVGQLNGGQCKIKNANAHMLISLKWVGSVINN